MEVDVHPRRSPTTSRSSDATSLRGLLELPDHLLERVIDKLARIRSPSLALYPVAVPYKGNPSALAALCLTCRRLNKLATPLLYRHTGVWLGQDKSSASDRLLRTLLESTTASNATGSDQHRHTVNDYVSSAMIARIDQDVLTVLPRLRTLRTVHLRIDRLESHTVGPLQHALASLSHLSDICIGWRKQSGAERTDLTGAIPPHFTGLLEIRHVTFPNVCQVDSRYWQSSLPPKLERLSFLYDHFPGPIGAAGPMSSGACLVELSFKKCVFNDHLLIPFHNLFASSLTTLTLDFLNAVNGTTMPFLAYFDNLSSLSIGNFQSRAQRIRTFSHIPSRSIRSLHLFGIDTEGFEDAALYLLPKLTNLQKIRISMRDEFDITDQPYTEREWAARWSHGVKGACLLDGICRQRGVLTDPTSFGQRMLEIQQHERYMESLKLGEETYTSGSA